MYLQQKIIRKCYHGASSTPDCDVMDIMTDASCGAGYAYCSASPYFTYSLFIFGLFWHLCLFVSFNCLIWSWFLIYPSWSKCV